MLISSFDIRSVIHREFVPIAQTVNFAFYLEVLKRLRTRVARVCPELAVNGGLLYHDNALSHSTLVVCEFLAEKSIPLLAWGPYSPDIASCAFFPKMKNQIKGTRSKVLRTSKRTRRVFLRKSNFGGVPRLLFELRTSLEALRRVRRDLFQRPVTLISLYYSIYVCK